MKKYILAVSTLLLIAVTNSKGQDCKAYFPMKEGVSFEITNYNAKGKEVGKAHHKVTKYEELGSTVLVDVTTEVMTEDNQDEPIIFDYQVQCEDGNFRMNRFGGISSDQMGMMNGMVTIDGDFLDIPNG